jgi:hypothetical protein
LVQEFAASAFPVAGEVIEPAPPRRRTRVVGAVPRVEYALCSLIVLFGMVIRVPGFAAGDLWPDDAWITLPVRVGLREALRMDVSTPLFLLALRQWAMLDLSSTAFIQLLPFTASLLAIAAVWWLVRTIGGRMWTRVLVTTFAAANPLNVIYSMRVKEYSVEVLLGLLLLICLAKAVQGPSARRSIALLALSVVACVTSGALVLFVGGVLVSFAIQGLRAHRQRDRYWMATVVGTCVAMVGSFLAFYDHLPPLLNREWAPLEFNSGNPNSLVHTIGVMGSGIATGFLGLHLETQSFPREFDLTGAGFDAAFITAGVVFVALLALIGGSLWLTRSPITAAGTCAIASSAVIMIAILAAVTGHAPLGGGRTDLWWYPAVWCLAAIVIEAAFRRFSPGVRRLEEPVRRSITVVAAVLLAVTAVLFGFHYRSVYPTQDLRALFAQNQAQLRPTDWIYVEPAEAYVWALYGLGPFHIQFDTATNDPSDTGWRVVIDKFDAQERVILDPSSVCARTSRIWWIGKNASEFTPAAESVVGPRHMRIVAPTGSFANLLDLGWRQSEIILGRGVSAILYTHPGTCDQ